jgi:hypothetical protein
MDEWVYGLASRASQVDILVKRTQIMDGEPWMNTQRLYDLMLNTLELFSKKDGLEATVIRIAVSYSSEEDVVSTHEKSGYADFDLNTFLPVPPPETISEFTLMQRAAGYRFAEEADGSTWKVYKDGAYTYGDGASSLASKFWKREEVEHAIDDREPIGLRIVEWRDEREGKLLE